MPAISTSFPSRSTRAFPKTGRATRSSSRKSRAAYRRLLNLGLTDAFRACEAGPDHYTFWDYQAGAWQKNNGIRIDHMLLSPQATDRLVDCAIDKRTRGWEKPSDHVPVVIDLDFQKP